MGNSLLANKYNAEKTQFYLTNYEKYFRPLKDQEVHLLELGVRKGDSLLLWRDYFQTGPIAGLDLNQVDISDTSGRIHIYQGDQTDFSLLDRIGQECAPAGFDIIIDDASHIGELTDISFWHLFMNWLKPGGIYVIEDWRLGYWDAWPDGRKYKFSKKSKSSVLRLFRKLFHTKPQFKSHTSGMVGFIKQLMDELGMDAITSPSRGAISPQRFPRFQRMDIYAGQVFIIKATQEDQKLMALNAL